MTEVLVIAFLLLLTFLPLLSGVVIITTNNKKRSQFMESLRTLAILIVSGLIILYTLAMFFVTVLLSGTYNIW